MPCLFSFVLVASVQKCLVFFFLVASSITAPKYLTMYAFGFFFWFFCNSLVMMHHLIYVYITFYYIHTI